MIFFWRTDQEEVVTIFENQQNCKNQRNATRETIKQCTALFTNYSAIIYHYLTI